MDARTVRVAWCALLATGGIVGAIIGALIGVRATRNDPRQETP